MRLLIIGGDARNRHLATLARINGHTARLIGHGTPSFQEAVPFGCVVMPFPVAEAEGYAPAPLSGEKLPMVDMCALIAPKATVFATKPGPILTEYIQKNSCTSIDFLSNEAFSVRNAVPSAEGGIHALMSHTSACIGNSDCLVVGYGRIGRALAMRLKGLGAHVTVAARGEASRANAQNDGYRAVPIEWMNERHECHFLINTVPARIIGADKLAALPPGALALDLASAPFGFDVDEAKELGIEAWRELSLPGRYAPETAAKAMLALIEEKDGA